MAGFTTYYSSKAAPLSPEDEPEVLLFGEMDEEPKPATIAPPLDLEMAGLLARYFNPRGPQELSVRARCRDQSQLKTTHTQNLPRIHLPDVIAN